MPNALFTRDHPESTAINAELKQLVEAEQCYLMALRHAQQFEVYKSELQNRSLTPNAFNKGLSSMERELKEAITIYQRSIHAYIKRLANRSAMEFLSLNAPEQIQLQEIVARHKLALRSVDVPPKLSGYDEGLSHGTSDGEQRLPKKMRPSLIRALLKETYRQDYFRGYRQGYARALRRSNRATELSLISKSIRSCRRER